MANLPLAAFISEDCRTRAGGPTIPDAAFSPETVSQKPRRA